MLQIASPIDVHMPDAVLSISAIQVWLWVKGYLDDGHMVFIVDPHRVEDVFSIDDIDGIRRMGVIRHRVVATNALQYLLAVWECLNRLYSSLMKWLFLATDPLDAISHHLLQGMLGSSRVSFSPAQSASISARPE